MNYSPLQWVGMATSTPRSLCERQEVWHAGILCFMYNNCCSSKCSEVKSWCTVWRWTKHVIGPTGKGLSLSTGHWWLSNTLSLLQRKNNRKPSAQSIQFEPLECKLVTVLAAWHGMMHHYLFWLHSMSSLASTVSDSLNKGHYFQKDKSCINPFMLLSAE